MNEQDKEAHRKYMREYRKVKKLVAEKNRDELMELLRGCLKSLEMGEEEQLKFGIELALTRIANAKVKL
jgi:hypothetical protein